jgi:hypothetical protein
MARFTPKAILSAFSAISGLNSNFQVLSTLFDRVLLRDGSDANQMLSNLNMNNFSIQNTASPVSRADVVTKGYVDDSVDTKINVSLLGTTGGIADSFGTSTLLAPSQRVVSTILNGSQPITYKTRTVAAKLADTVNVYDYGATGLGPGHDDYGAFVAAFNAVAPGGTIYVNKPTVSYYLSANPDPYQQATLGSLIHNFKNKYVNWEVDYGTIFSGPGFGLPVVNSGDVVAGPLFLSQINNPYNQTLGSYRQIDMSQAKTLNGGCLIGESVELTEDFGYGITITGDVTNGSPTITNVVVTSGGTFDQIRIGDRLVSSLSGWPSYPFNQVWSTNPQSVTFGIDAGAGPAGLTNWTGPSQTGVTFTVYKKAWYAALSLLYSTGGPNSVAMAYGGINYVANITGAPTNIIEGDLIALTDAGGLPSRFIFGTGHGDSPHCIMYGIDLQRAGKAPWTVAFSARSADTGLYLNASKPVSLDTAYGNPITGLVEPIKYGIHFNNINWSKNSLLEGAQIVDGTQAISIARATDVNPLLSGRYIQCLNAANNVEFFYVDILGGVHANSPADINGSTTKSGSLMANGITITSGTNLQLGVTRTAASVTTNGYITVYGSDGQPIKLATVA